MIRGKFFQGSEKTQNIATGIMDLWKCCCQAVVQLSANNYHQHFPQHQHKEQVNNINNFSVQISQLCSFSFVMEHKWKSKLSGAIN